MKRVWVVRLGLVLVGLAWLGSGCVSTLATGEGLTLGDGLRIAMSPNGIPLIVGVLFSVLMEYVPGFGELAPKWKRASFFGACVVVPVVAGVAGVWLQGWVLGEALWQAVVAGVTAFGAGTLAHLPKLPSAPAVARMRIIGE